MADEAKDISIRVLSGEEMADFLGSPRAAVERPTSVAKQLSIAGLDKAKLLRKLWDNSRPAPFFATNNVPAPPFDSKEVDKALKGEIDYFCGRLIRCNLSGDTVYVPRHYDQDTFPGNFAATIDRLRQEEFERLKDVEGKLERLCTKLRYLVRAGAAYQALTDKTVLAFINDHPELKEDQDKLLYIIRAGTAYQTVVDRTVEELIAAEEKINNPPKNTGLPVIDETTSETNPVNE